MVLMGEASREKLTKGNEIKFVPSTPDFVFVVTDIMKAFSKQDVLNIIESYDKPFHQLKYDAYRYLQIYNYFEYTKEQIENRLKIYIDYKRQITKEKQQKQHQEKHQMYVDENIDTARKIINEYLNGDYEKIQVFCNTNSIDIKKFE